MPVETCEVVGLPVIRCVMYKISFLGEHGEWCKHTNFEIATHAPMMVSVPSLTDDGVVTERLTEFVDLFPTLAEAAGLKPVSTVLALVNTPFHFVNAI